MQFRIFEIEEAKEEEQEEATQTNRRSSGGEGEGPRRLTRGNVTGNARGSLAWN